MSVSKALGQSSENIPAWPRVCLTQPPVSFWSSLRQGWDRVWRGRVTSSQPWSSPAIIKPAGLRFAHRTRLRQFSVWELRGLCADCLQDYSLKDKEIVRPPCGMPSLMCMCWGNGVFLLHEVKRSLARGCAGVGKAACWYRISKSRLQARGLLDLRETLCLPWIHCGGFLELL